MAHVIDAHKQEGVRCANSSMQVETVHIVLCRRQRCRALLDARNKFQLKYFEFKLLNWFWLITLTHCCWGQRGAKIFNRNWTKLKQQKFPISYTRQRQLVLDCPNYFIFPSRLTRTRSGIKIASFSFKFWWGFSCWCDWQGTQLGLFMVENGCRSSSFRYLMY